MSYTYALLEVSPAAYAEIREKLVAAGYEHAFGEDEGREVIDMHGIALVVGDAETTKDKLRRLISDEIARHEAHIEMGGTQEYLIAKRAGLSLLKRLLHDAGN